MSFVAVAAIGTAAVGSAYAADRSSSAIAGGSKRALRYQQVNNREERELQREFAETRRRDFQPWRNVGRRALTTLEENIRSGAYEAPVFDYANVDLNADPGYQFRMDQGQKALENSAAVRGGVLSGAQLKAATRYGQDYGSQEYAAAYARELDSVNRETARRHNRFSLMSMLSDRGLTAAGQQAAVTGQQALVSSDINSNANRAGTQILQNAGLARGQVYSDTATALNQGIQNWITYRQSQPQGGESERDIPMASNRSNTVELRG